MRYIDCLVRLDADNCCNKFEIVIVYLLAYAIRLIVIKLNWVGRWVVNVLNDHTLVYPIQNNQYI